MTAPTLPICERARKQAKCIYIAVEETVADDISDYLTQSADTIEALYEALEELVDGYRSEADPYSCGGFCRNLDEDDCMVTALAALSRARNGGQP